MGLPLVEEIEDVFGSHGASGFEFAAFLAEEELAVVIENGNGGNAAFEGNIVFLGDVEILVHLADVDVDNDEGFIEGGSDFGAVEGFVEDVAIEAPVAAEDDEDAFVAGRGRLEGVGNFGVGIERGIVDLLAVERLAETRGGGALHDDEGPVLGFLMPALDHGDEFFLRSGAGLEGKGDLEDEEMEIGLRLAFLEEVGGKTGESLGFEGGPEGEFVGERERLVVEAGDMGLGGLAVEGGESRGVSGEDGGTPLLERRKGWSGGPRVGGEG